MNIHAGKALGGSTIINSMIFVCLHFMVFPPVAHGCRSPGQRKNSTTSGARSITIAPGHGTISYLILRSLRYSRRLTRFKQRTGYATIPNSMDSARTDECTLVSPISSSSSLSFGWRPLRSLVSRHPQTWQTETQTLLESRPTH